MAKKMSLIEQRFAKHDVAAPKPNKINRRKKSTRKIKEVNNMPAPKAQPTGLKAVKSMLQDRVEIDALQDILDRPNQKKLPKTEQKPKAKAVNAMPLNPISSILQNPEVASNMDPNQLMQMSMMSNPQTAMMYMLMQGMGGKQKTTEDVGNLKDLAEIISVLKNDGGGGSKDEFTKMMMIELLKRNREPQGNTQMMEMMQLFQTQMDKQLGYWQQRAMQAEQGAHVDPITSLLESKEKLTNLQAVFGGGTPEDQAMRVKQFEAQLLMQNREYDMQDKAIVRQVEAQKSAQQMDLLSKGLAAFTDYVVKPTMGAVKDGIINNPNAFEKIRNPDPALPSREDFVPDTALPLPEMRENIAPPTLPEPMNPFLAPLPNMNPSPQNPETPIESLDSMPNAPPTNFTEDHIVPRPTAKGNIKLP